MKEREREREREREKKERKKGKRVKSGMNSERERALFIQGETVQHGSFVRKKFSSALDVRIELRFLNRLELIHIWQFRVLFVNSIINLLGCKLFHRPLNI